MRWLILALALSQVRASSYDAADMAVDRVVLTKRGTDWYVEACARVPDANGGRVLAGCSEPRLVERAATQTASQAVWNAARRAWGAEYLSPDAGVP